jgi:hypothetical protein
MEFKEYEYYNWAKYQWEFKRRSPEYKKIYQKHIKEHGAPSSTQFIAYPDPSLSFDEIMNTLESSEPTWANFHAYLMLTPMSVTTYHGEDSAKLKITIDFKRINSVESVKKYVAKKIDDAYLEMKKLKVLPKKKKKSMVDFNLILQVGDLKREGKKNREIAEIIDPRKYKENPESAIRLIAYYHKKYLKLINGGYIHITYP